MKNGKKCDRLKPFSNKFFEWISEEEKMKKCWQHLYLKIIVIAFFINIIIEVLGRHSFSGAFHYMVESPMVFLLNIGIILLLFLPVFLTRRKWIFFSSTGAFFHRKTKRHAAPKIPADERIISGQLI